MHELLKLLRIYISKYASRPLHFKQERNCRKEEKKKATEINKRIILAIGQRISDNTCDCKTTPSISVDKKGLVVSTAINRHH